MNQRVIDTLRWLRQVAPGLEPSVQIQERYVTIDLPCRPNAEYFVDVEAVRYVQRPASGRQGMTPQELHRRLRKPRLIG